MSDASEHDPAADAAAAAPAGPSRARIVEAAWTLLAVDPSTAMQDIAREAGVGRATAHRHFPTRDDLMRTLGLEALREAQAALDRARPDDGPTPAVLERLIAELVPMGHRFHFLLATRFDDDYRISEDVLARQLAALAERGRRDGCLATDVPTVWVVDALAALVFAAWEAIHDGRLAPRDAPRLVTRTLLAGLSGSADRREEPAG